METNHSRGSGKANLPCKKPNQCCLKNKEKKMKLLLIFTTIFNCNLSEFLVETINKTRNYSTTLQIHTPMGSQEFSPYPSSQENSSYHNLLPQKWSRRTCKAMLTTMVWHLNPKTPMAMLANYWHIAHTCNISFDVSEQRLFRVKLNSEDTTNLIN